MFGLNVKKSFLLFFGVAFFLSVSNLHATTLSPETFTLNGMYYSPVKDVYSENNEDNDTLISYFDTNDFNLLTGIYNATHTAGIFAGNDTGDLKPVNNIGELNDGLLNDPEYFSPDGAFIGEEGNYLQDADGDGSGLVDPGWIMLGEFEVGKEPDYQNLGGDDGVDIGTLLQMTFDFDIQWTTGNWVLWTDPDKMAVAYAELGFAAFDNLAFVIKSGNDWAVYDFNFNYIFRNERDEHNNTQLNFETAYTLWGDFDNLDFTTNEGLRDISHFSVWVRDPVLNSSQIPEPATILLFGFGLLGVAHIGRRKK